MEIVSTIKHNNEVGSVTSGYHISHGCLVTAAKTKAMVYVQEGDEPKHYLSQVLFAYKDITSMDTSPRIPLTIAAGTRKSTIALWSLPDVRRNRKKNADIHKPLEELKGHEAAVTGVAFNEDGMYISSCSKDKTFKIWNSNCNVKATSRKRLQFSSSFPDLLTCCSWLSNRIALGSDSGAVRVWDSKSLKEMNKLSHLHSVCSIDISDEMIAAGYGHKGHLLTHDLRSDAASVIRRAHEWGAVVAVKWHSSINYSLATGGEDGSVKVWDIRRPQRELLRHNLRLGSIRCLDWWNDQVLIGNGKSLSISTPVVPNS